jgi:CubicO group peptidase (beta-lactamase class C family)
VVVNCHAEDPRFGWFGGRASARSYGHAGYFSTVAFADPAHALVVALAFVGVREDAEHGARTTEALDSVYRDLGLGEGV